MSVLPLLTLLICLLVPALLWWMRRYQHQHYALGAQVTRFTVGPGAYYALFARAALVFMAIAAVVGVLAAFMVPMLVMAAKGGAGSPLSAVGMVASAMAVLAAYLLMMAVGGSYITARMQDLVWNGTRSEHLRFSSRLSARGLAWLSCKNWLLVLLTLGLYLPFAAVAKTKLRLEAMRLQSTVSPDALVAGTAAQNEAAAGDAAGDLFGFDVGL